MALNKILSFPFRQLPENGLGDKTIIEMVAVLTDHESQVRLHFYSNLCYVVMYVFAVSRKLINYI